VPARRNVRQGLPAIGRVGGSLGLTGTLAFRHAGVAFRPTITRGLALSVIYFKTFFPIRIKSNFNAKKD